MIHNLLQLTIEISRDVSLKYIVLLIKKGTSSLFIWELHKMFYSWVICYHAFINLKKQLYDILEKSH